MRSCRYHQTMKCKARLTTSGDRVVSSLDPGHNQCQHCSCTKGGRENEEQDNGFDRCTIVVASKQLWCRSYWTNDTLMALPRRATVSKALWRHRKKVTDAANGTPYKEEVSKSQRSSPEDCQCLWSVRGAALFTCHRTITSRVERTLLLNCNKLLSYIFAYYMRLYVRD